MEKGGKRKLYLNVKEKLFHEFVEPLLEAGGEIPPKKALSQHYGVNVGTLDKALQELEVEGYISKRVGIGTFVLAQEDRSRGKLMALYCSIDVSVCNKASRYLFLLNEALQRELSKRGLSFRVYADMRLPEDRHNPLPELAADVEAGNVLGVVIQNMTESSKKWLENLGIPLVAHGHDYGWGTVSADFKQAGYDAGVLLAQAGCRNIEFLSALVHEWSHIEQHRSAALNSNRPLRAGIANALRPLGIAAPEAWLAPELLPESMNDSSMEVEDQGYVMGKLMMEHRNTDGVVVYTDVFGIGVCRALRESGRIPGKDIQVVVLGNKGLVFPGIAGVIHLDLPIEKIAEGIVSLMEAAVHGKPPRELVLSYESE